MSWVRSLGTPLFGIGARLAPVVLFESGVLLAAAACACVGAIVSATCVDFGARTICSVGGTPLGLWLQFVALSAAISVPCRLLDALAFAGLAALAAGVVGGCSQARRGGLLGALLAPAAYWAGAFEGAAARFVWLGLTAIAADAYLAPSTALERALSALAVFQALAVARNVALRLVLRTVLLASFEEAIATALSAQLVLLAVARPRTLDDAGRVRAAPGDAAYAELLRIVQATSFKRKLDYVASMRFRMYDADGVLVQQTKTVQAARQIRFATLADIARRKTLLRTYLTKAIALEKSGAKVKMKSAAEFEVPDELRERLKADPVLAEAFRGLTPGRQRAYLLHFSGAKQSATRSARIERHAPRIRKGLGLDD